MGPRFASLRHPNVVMAPALTDARQTPKLRLTPTNATPNPTDTSLSSKLSNGKHCNKIIQCKRILAQTQNTICSLPVKRIVSCNLKTEHKINFQVIATNSSNLNSKVDLSYGSLNKPKINKESQVIDRFKVGEASDYNLALQSGCDFMMNNSGTPMGDLDENMGLTKSDSESINYMKEKGCCSTDVDQLFKNFQNVDEILQVIKSMENSGETELGPLDPGPSTEAEGINSIFPISDGSELPSGLANFDRDLFTDVDVMSMCVDENLTDNGLVINKETLIKEKDEDIRKKQHCLERRVQRMLRRLHKLQARTIGKQACEEVSGFLEQVNETVGLSDGGPSSSNVKHIHIPMTCDGNCDKDCKRKCVNNNLGVLFRRLEQASQQQALSAHRQNKSCRYFGSGSRDYTGHVASANGLKSFPMAGGLVPKLSDSVKSGTEEVMGQLHTQLKVVENGVDSDVTASSSGGESCDEMQASSSQPYLQSTMHQPQQNLSISKRAIWRWAHDRAEVASKWTWLQAQVSDLEYRIRQHTEFHRQIRNSKPAVVLQGEDAVVMNGYHSTTSSDSAASCTTTCSRSRPLVRNLFAKRKLLQMDGLHVCSKKAARPATVRCGCRPPDHPCALCTGRPDPTHPRDPPDLMTVNERIALLDPAFHPVLSFHTDVSQSVHFEALMRNPEWQQKAMRSSVRLLRVADSTTSSATTDRSKDVLSDGGRRLASVNVSSSHRRLIMAITGDGLTVNTSTPTANAASLHKKYNNTSNTIRKSVSNSFTDKIKRLARGRKVKGLKDSNHSLDRLSARKRLVRHSTHLSADVNAGADDNGLNCSGVNYSNSGHHLDGSYSSHAYEQQLDAHEPNGSRPSPAPSPTPLSAGSKEYTRRKRENSYDIDNIVIPYSVASATRLEKLQYKEILTPKWRVLPIEPLAVNNKLDTKNNGVIRRSSSHESDVEDLSEETLIIRHEKCEQDERKKFSTYLKLPNSFGRTRGHRRTDSRAESSGANTPVDPMSPATTENLKDGGSPMTSPPATPLAPVSEGEGTDVAPPPVAQVKVGPGRRRTVSLSSQAQPPTPVRLPATANPNPGPSVAAAAASPAVGLRCTTDKDDTRPNTPVDFLFNEVLPYEPRTFPLPDDAYEKMLRAMPPGHPCLTSPNSSVVSGSEDQTKPAAEGAALLEMLPTDVEMGNGPVMSPMSDSTESAVEEDPNDPEWTVSTCAVDRSLNSKR